MFRAGDSLSEGDAPLGKDRDVNAGVFALGEDRRQCQVDGVVYSGG
jgi:hypothetical protein